MTGERAQSVSGKPQFPPFPVPGNHLLGCWKEVERGATSRPLHCKSIQNLDVSTGVRRSWAERDRQAHAPTRGWRSQSVM